MILIKPTHYLLMQAICVGLHLTQTLEHDIYGKKANMQHSITYQSGLCKESQLNWSALIKETYVIYTSVKKMADYQKDVDITLKRNNLSLKILMEEYFQPKSE